MAELPDVRIAFEIPRDLHNALNDTNTIPWGSKKAIFVKLLELLLEMLKRDGPAVLGFIMAGEIELRVRKGVLDALYEKMEREKKHE